MEEFWKPTPYPDYDVNTSGVVRSWKSGEPVALTQYLDKSGYWRVSIYVDGKSKHFSVHRLVAQAFIPNPDNKPQVNHKNGIKTDNRVENLEWCTAAENQRHAVATGLIAQGEEHWHAKLANEQALYVRENPDHLTTKELAAKFGVTYSTISDIQIGNSFKNVGGKVRGKFNISDNIRAEIKRLYVKGSREFGTVALAKKFGLNQKTIWKIVNEPSRE